MIENECLCCGKKLRLECSLLEMLYVDDVICLSCRKKLGFHPKKIKIQGKIVYGLYPYQDLVRDLMIQYKEYNDEALKSVFLYKQFKTLSKKYKDYVIVPIPSSEQGNQRRGFQQVEEMFSFIQLPFRKVLYKTEDVSQKELGYKERRQISKVLAIRDPQIIEGKKVLIVDDILTTGNTISAAVRLLEPYCKRIDIVVACYNKRYLNRLERLISSLDQFGFL